jgi:hypothetical protein
MAEVDYIHICDYAFLAEGGKPCIIGIFDVIGGTAFPLVHPQMAIAFRVQDTPHGLLSLRIELARPNGEALMGLDGQVALGPDGSAFIEFKLQSTPFPEPGSYAVRVLTAGRLLATRGLRVEKIAAPPHMPMAAPSSSAPVH